MILLASQNRDVAMGRDLPRPGASITTTAHAFLVEALRQHGLLDPKQLEEVAATPLTDPKVLERETQAAESRAPTRAGNVRRWDDGPLAVRMLPPACPGQRVDATSDVLIGS